MSASFRRSAYMAALVALAASDGKWRHDRVYDRFPNRGKSKNKPDTRKQRRKK